MSYRLDIFCPLTKDACKTSCIFYDEEEKCKLLSLINLLGDFGGTFSQKENQPIDESSYITADPIDCYSCPYWTGTGCSLTGCCMTKTWIYKDGKIVEIK